MKRRRKLDLIFEHWVRPHADPARMRDRLIEVEAAFQSILQECGCWNCAHADLNNLARFAGLRSMSKDKHLLKAAHARQVLAASTGLAACQRLRDMLSKCDRPHLIAAAALVVGESLVTLKLEPLAAKGAGSRRVQRTDEAVKDEMSSLLYLLVRAAFQAGDLTGSLVLAYERALPPEKLNTARPEVVGQEQSQWLVYRPRSEQAFHRKVSDWRAAGLVD